MPFGLLDGAKLIKPLTRDQNITYEMVELRTDTMLYDLRKIQDKVIAPTRLD